jgi:simple sugar transport system ATP-binding protein
VEERDEGRAILLVSLELEEIRSLSDRVLVIYEGAIVAELPPSASEEDFGFAMTGGGLEEVTA